MEQEVRDVFVHPEADYTADSISTRLKCTHKMKQFKVILLLSLTVPVV